MKKITSFILTLVLLVTFSIIPVSAEKPVLTGLSEIGEVEVVPGMGYGFTYTDEVRKIRMYEKNMEESDLNYFLEVFSDDSLVCVDFDINEEVTPANSEWPAEGTFEFYAKGEKYYVFNFNREKVLVSISDMEEWIYYQGWFEFKNDEIFNQLIEYIDEIQKRNEKEDDEEPGDGGSEEEEKYKFDNQVAISNFKIEYDGIIKNLRGFEFNWGVCSYIREGESKPVYVCYYGIINEPEHKAFIVSEIIEQNNTVVLSNMKRFVLVNDNQIEFDNKVNLPFSYKLQVNVTEDMQAENITVSYVNNNEQEWITEEVDMNEYTQTGKLPTEMFSAENNIKQEEPIDKTEETKQEEAATQKQEDKKEEINQNKEKEPSEKEENKEQEQEKDEPQNTEEKKQVESETDVVSEEFIDVPKTHWAYGNVAKFSKRKIVLGYGNGYFGVDDSITYEHFGLLLDRMFEYKAENIESTPAIREDVIVSIVKALNWDVTDADESIIEKTFSDCSGLKSENRKYIAKAIENGLVKGYAGKLFADNNLTRAETVTLLARAEEY